MNKSEQLYTELANVKEQALQALQQKCKDILFAYNKKLKADDEEPITDAEFLNLKRNITLVSHEDGNLNQYIDELRMDGLMCSVRCEGDNYDQKIEELETEQIIAIIELLEQDTDPEIL